jgi:ribosome-binding protein aMBF1 (putative translation factor)
MTKISTLHKNWLKDPAYKDAYESLITEFELAQKLIEVRVKSGMSQEELAQKMGTLSKLALATDCEMHINFKPPMKSANPRTNL